MINSLLKDSHITRKSRFLKSPSTESGVQKRELNCAAPENRMMNNSDIIMKKPAEISFSGFFNAKELCEKNWFKKLLVKAADNQVVFSAGFALLLTGLFRPVTICALPGKKNKDDKKYAAANSIASGVIGFVMAFIFANPVAEAVKKIKDNPKTFMPKNFKALTAKTKDAEALKSTVVHYLNQLPDILISSPKAIITIAILPPILKHIFGLEKKKTEKVQVEQIYPILNFKSSAMDKRKSLQNFMGGKN